MATSWGFSRASTPFDAAPDGRALFGIDRTPGQYRVDGGADVRGRDRSAVLGPGIVELASVDQSTFAVENERVRCAGCRVRAGDVLGFVIEIREGPAVAAGLRDHLIGPVLRVGDHVVA